MLTREASRLTVPLHETVLEKLERKRERDVDKHSVDEQLGTTQYRCNKTTPQNLEICQPAKYLLAHGLDLGNEAVAEELAQEPRPDEHQLEERHWWPTAPRFGTTRLAQCRWQ